MRIPYTGKRPVGAIDVTVRIEGDADEILEQLERLRKKGLVKTASLTVVVPEPSRFSKKEERAFAAIEGGKTDHVKAEMQYIERRMTPEQLRHLEEVIDRFGALTS